jgi:hypothetical protein
MWVISPVEGEHRYLAGPIRPLRSHVRLGPMAARKERLISIISKACSRCVRQNPKALSQRKHGRYEPACSVVVARNGYREGAHAAASASFRTSWTVQIIAHSAFTFLIPRNHYSSFRLGEKDNRGSTHHGRASAGIGLYPR